jgi:16S rRNA (guanine(966)-N(2))-methyltransferase RsmD
VRIIAGESHGRRLKAPRGTLTRPTTARVRQSIFSRLTARIDLAGLAVLDLFAGSGSLGIEALSRGAAHTTFVDSSPGAARTIRANLDELGLGARGTIVSSEVRHALANLASRGERFDLVFVDAPYRDDFTAEVLDRLVDLNLLTGQAWVVARQYYRATAPEGRFAKVLERMSVAKIGDHRVALYRRMDQPAG